MFTQIQVKQRYGHLVTEAENWLLLCNQQKPGLASPPPPPLVLEKLKTHNRYRTFGGDWMATSRRGWFRRHARTRAHIHTHLSPTNCHRTTQLPRTRCVQLSPFLLMACEKCHMLQHHAHSSNTLPPSASSNWASRGITYSISVISVSKRINTLPLFLLIDVEEWVGSTGSTESPAAKCVLSTGLQHFKVPTAQRTD